MLTKDKLLKLHQEVKQEVKKEKGNFAFCYLGCNWSATSTMELVPGN